MNGIDFLADTNFLIHLNQGESFIEPFLDYSFSVSYIKEIELLGAFSLPKLMINQYQSLLNDCFIIEMDYKIKKACITIRKKYKIKIPDAIIAATAIVYNIPLITSDQAFQKIKELELIYIEK
jgi:predicted nucleic acid-binding protein